MKIARNLFFSIGVGIFLALCVSEIISFLRPSFGIFGIVVWIMSFGLLAIYSIYQYGRIILSLLRPRKHGSSPITAVILTGILLLILVQVPRLPNVNFETTQQVACALDRMLDVQPEAGAGFRASCFLGYPNRQYIIPALPSLIFGREIWSLNMGGALYIVVGLICFTAGLLKHFTPKKGEAKSGRHADIVVGIALASILHLYYFNHMALWFEQSIFPFTFGLMFVGLWLSFRHKKEIGYLPLLGFALAYLVFSYTPSLALLGFAIVILLYMMMQKTYSRATRMVILLIVTYILAAFVFSLGFRSDIRFSKDPRLVNTLEAEAAGEVGSMAVSADRIMLSDLITTSQKFILREFPVNSMSPFLHPIIVYLLFASLFGVFGWKYFSASMWAIATMFFAAYSHGFADPVPEFALHRALVIYPLLLLMLAQLMFRFLESSSISVKWRRYTLYFGVAFVFLLGLLYHQSYVVAKANYQAPYINTKEAVRHTTYITWLTELRESSQISNGPSVSIVIDQSIRSEFVSLPDRLRYFLPEYSSRIHEGPCEAIVNEGVPTYFLLPDADTSGEVIMQPCEVKEDWKFIGQFTFDNERRTTLYEIL